MGRATLRFYAELNDFLAPERREVSFISTFRGTLSVKDLVESLGVPHTEIDLILVDGETQGLNYQVRDGDRISVYPVFESLDIGTLVRLRPRPLREPRFVLDVHLGRLAAYLRMLGFDATYQSDLADDDVAALAGREGRILLTKDRQLPERSVVTHAYWVREASPRKQALEVLRRFDLAGAIAPFRRCLACNGLLEASDKAQGVGRLPPRVAEGHSAFAVCSSCGRVYSRGAHYQRMATLIDHLAKAASSHEAP